MSLLSLNDSQIISSFNNQPNVVFEPPSLSSMNANDKTEGYSNYIYSHGNNKLNASIDHITKENSKMEIALQKLIYSNDKINPDAIKNLLNIEERASNTEFAEILCAIDLLKKIYLETKEIEEEINKYTAIKEKLEKEINNFLD